MPASSTISRLPAATRSTQCGSAVSSDRVCELGERVRGDHLVAELVAQDACVRRGGRA